MATVPRMAITFTARSACEIDSRARYLTKRIESAEVVDPERQKNRDQVFFGCTVKYARKDNTQHRVTIVGIDEADLGNGKTGCRPSRGRW